MISDVVYSFDKNNKPVQTASSGETLVFKTMDCFSNLVTCEKDLINETFDFNKANPASGPVFIKDAKPGDILKVKVIKVEVADKGAVTTIPDVGPLYHKCVDRTRILEIKNNKTKLGDIEMTINPMVGVMGVAPAGEPMACGFAGDHGGNMDCKLITQGSTLYFPIQVEGALLQMGDIHAIMGDCELCGTGLEIPGVITVQVELIKGKKLSLPLLETKDMWFTVSSHKDYTQALIKASEQMQELVGKAYKLDPTDTYLYLSLEGDVNINQACQPCPVELVLRLGVPKRSGKDLI